MVTSPFRQKFKQEVRGEILRLAREQFVHEGYGGFSIRRLAERAGCVPSAVYKHFTNKGEIFDCLVDESFEALMQAAESVRDIPEEDPINRLKRGMKAYVTFGLKNPDHYQLAFILKSPVSRRSAAPHRSYEGLKGRIRKCVEAGRLPEGDLNLMAQSLWAPVHGLTSLLIQKPLFPWARRSELISQIIDSAVLGLAQAPTHCTGSSP
jgi:AcrR family transcriptional regulator